MCRARLRIEFDVSSAAHRKKKKKKDIKSVFIIYINS